MAATNQNIKNFFALSGNNPAVTNGQLTRLAAAMQAKYAGEGVTVDADWLVDWIYQQLKNETIYHEQDEAASTARAGVRF